jgi:acyl-CoA synthetase (AMP-forming)/AMP-acid ligase II
VVGAPDTRTGEAVHAFVVAAPGASITPEILVEFARESLAPYKIPARVDIVAAIPRNAAGKVLRRELKG